MAKAEIVDCEDYCELIVRNKRGEEVARSKFDKHHRAKVEGLCWSMGTGGYPRNIRHRSNLHQVIMGRKPGLEVDHINGDKLDSRDTNLRFVTHTQNSRNLPLSKRNKSGCRGVWYDPRTHSWMAKICVDRQQLFLGRHKQYEDAVRIRKEAEKQYYGEYTR